MSVLAKSSSDTRSANSGLGGSDPFFGLLAVLAACPFAGASSGWSCAGSAGSKNPAGLVIVAMRRRLLIDRHRIMAPR